MNWDKVVLFITILITIAKLMDYIFVYNKKLIQDKLATLWIKISYLNLNKIIFLSLEKSHLLLSIIFGETLIKNIFIFIILNIIFANFNTLYSDSHLIMALFNVIPSFISLLITKKILMLAQEKNNIGFTLLFIFYDILACLFIADITLSIITILSSPFANTIETFSKLGGGNFEGWYIYAYYFLEYAKTFFIPIALPSIIIFFTFIMIMFIHIIAKPTTFFLERVVYVAVEDMQKSIFTIIASALSTIIALGNAIVKVLS